VAKSSMQHLSRRLWLRPSQFSSQKVAYFQSFYLPNTATVDFYLF
jgi:hypothetical protein